MTDALVPDGTAREQADALDRAAGHAWREGDHDRAAYLVTIASAIDSDRAVLWAERLDQIRGSAQPADLTLAELLARRLKAAGIDRDTDPAMSRIRAWNKAVLARGLEAGR